MLAYGAQYFYLPVTLAFGLKPSGFAPGVRKHDKAQWIAGETRYLDGELFGVSHCRGEDTIRRHAGNALGDVRVDYSNPCWSMASSRLVAAR